MNENPNRLTSEGCRELTESEMQTVEGGGWFDNIIETIAKVGRAAGTLISPIGI